MNPLLGHAYAPASLRYNMIFFSVPSPPADPVARARWYCSAAEQGERGADAADQQVRGGSRCPAYPPVFRPSTLTQCQVRGGVVHNIILFDLCLNRCVSIVMTFSSFPR